MNKTEQEPQSTSQPDSLKESCLLVSIPRAQLLIPESQVVGVFGAAQLSMAATGERWYGRHNGRTFPIVFFQRLVSGAPGSASGLPAASEWQAVQRQSVVLLQAGGQYAGLIVDEVGTTLSVTTRGFDRLVKSAPGLRGTACLPDGGVAYVVRAAEVIALAMIGTTRKSS